MNMNEFIEENRQELIAHIKGVCANCPTDDEEIEGWIANDESLYNWAKSEGVDV